MKPSRSLGNRIMAMLSICAAVILCGFTPGKWEIDNPYANVDWKQYRQVKANFHTHTRQSDGRMEPAEAIDKYHRLGYGVLALTDHDTVTWPWKTYDRDAERLGMVAIPGAEPSRHHHMGSYFCDVPGASSEVGTLAQVRQQGGVAVMFHPGRYAWSPQDYVALYKKWDELIGMEIFNQGDRYSGDRKTWDAVLTALMPEGRPVWGFSNDDMHLRAHLGRNWNVLLLPELSLEAVRTAMEKGVFFFVYAPKGHKGSMPPKINAIVVDARKGSIRIEASACKKIDWISGGKVVHHGATIDLAAAPNVHGYIRAVLHAQDDGSLIGTQPLRLRPRDK